ncbi:MAG: hypothetical protein JO115_15235 [Pseudonocardiales bacterium]|nr:hypothetical protein [Pseudonocardiales bacterium]
MDGTPSERREWVRDSMRWAYSVLDHQMHLLVSGDFPWGVLKTPCGAVVPPGPDQDEWPPTNQRRICRTCGVIARRRTTVPRDLWVSHPCTLGAHAVSLPPRQRLTAQVAWAWCPDDELVHLLGSWGLVTVRAQGEAVAWCGAHITATLLAVSGVWTPCPPCLAAGVS